MQNYYLLNNIGFNYAIVYASGAASLDGAALPVDGRASVLIPRVTIEALNAGAPHRITVTLRAAQ